MTRGPVATLGVAALAAMSFHAAPAEAGVQRFAVVIGNNTGSPTETPLRFAEQDAAKVRDVLRDLGGFSTSDLVLLQGESADEVRDAITKMNERVRQVVAKPDEQAFLVVYYSGHADATHLHLSGTNLEIREIEQLVRGSSANVRLLMLDACRSGALTRVKGGAKAPPVATRTDTPLAGQGAIFLTASAAGEDAQESDTLQGSFFTHYLVSGLRGAADRDGDGFVTIDEAYEHSNEATVRATSSTLNGTQHPTFRFEMRGRSPLVLTMPGSSSSKAGKLTFPTGKSYLVLSGSDSGQVLAEVGDTTPARTLTLRPGKYFVRARATDHLLEGTIDLAASATVDVSDDKLTKATYARMARKGDSPRPFAHGPRAAYAPRTGVVSGSSFCHGFSVGWPIALQYVEFAPSFTFCRSDFENDYLEATQDEFGGMLDAAYVIDVPYVSFALGLGAGGGVFRQTFDTRGVAPDRLTAYGRIAVRGDIQIDLGAGFYGDLGAAAETYLFQVLDDDGESGVTAAFAFRPTFGLGKWF